MSEHSLESATLLFPLLLFSSLLLAKIWSKFINSLMAQATRTFERIY